MNKAILTCPFCGFVGHVLPRSYGDGYSEVGCGNDTCHVKPRVSVKTTSHPWDETKQTFWFDYDKSDKEAIELWNRRANP